MFYEQDFITLEEETNLINSIDQLIWSNDLNRRTMQFGKRYSYKSKSLMNAKEIPPFLINIRDLLSEKFELDFDQVIINEYEPGQGISSHIDHIHHFGPKIVVLSLLSDTTMRFKFNNTIKEDKLLERRSLMMLENDWRYKYSHCINGSDINSRRVSITFRNLKQRK